VDKLVEIVENCRNSQEVGTHILGIFVKAPVAGQVKTRLCPPLTAEQAAALYRAALHETIVRMQKGPWRVCLFFASDADYFARHFPDLPRVAQASGDLGNRLQQALETLLTAGTAVALIGSDSPDLPLPQIENAFAHLAVAQTVCIPAADGGYVLIGARDLCPPLFSHIPWSTDQVLAETRRQAAAAGIAYVEVGGWEDIDDAAGLQRLLLRSPTSSTACYVREQLLGCLDLSPVMADNHRQTISNKN